MVTVVEFKMLHSEAVLPEYQTDGSAGADLYSVENLVIGTGETKVVDLGFSVAIPFGYEIQIRPRSGLAAKNQVTVLNSPGTIDSDYRGPVKVILSNFGADVFTVKVGDRIAQMVVAEVTKAIFYQVGTLETTDRSDGGFGSTGSD